MDLKFLLGYGADINSIDEEHRTPLWFVVENNCISNGKDVDKQRCKHSHQGQRPMKDTLQLLNGTRQSLLADGR